MKFILVLYLCSFAGPLVCDNGTIVGEYNSWRDCAMNGYNHSAASFSGYPKDIVNQQKMAIKFECKQLEGI